MDSTTKLLALATVGMASLGCNETIPTTPQELEPTEAAVEAAPQSQGAFVEFDETAVFFFHFDAQRGLLSAHLPSDFCSGAPLNVGDRQIVDTPSEIEQRFVKIQDGDSRVAIYRASSLDDLFSDFCGFLGGPTLVAEGTVRHTQTLSNASFAAHWGGTVESEDGTTFQLSEVFQLTADAQDPNNADKFSTNASKILLARG